MTIALMILRYWKAALAGILVLVLLGFLRHIDQNGYKRRINEEKAQEIALLHERIATISLVTSLDNQRVLASSKLLKNLESLAFETLPSAGPCLSRTAASRVRAIELPDPFAAPARSSRYPGMLQKRSERP